MAVLEKNSEGFPAPPPDILEGHLAQSQEMEDDYSKYTPSAECSAGRNIFRTKKLTKKRHESKARRTDAQNRSNVCYSDEDYPQTHPDRSSELTLRRSIPTMMMTINQTIKKMTLKDGSGNIPEDKTEAVEGEAERKVGADGGAECNSTEVGGDSAMSFEVESDLFSRGFRGSRHHTTSHCSNDKTDHVCSLSHHPQGKRRRHRRKQQYKRMAVDLQNDKKSLQLKTPTSNSSEDSGIGKRKRNIILSGSSGMSGSVNFPLNTIGPVPSTSTSQPHMQYPQQEWQLEPDNDAVMMDYEDFEGSSYTQGSKMTEEESGESNDELESLTDHNQDADDEESDYYNNDSSTTSLSESSFTVLNSSKKFIPVGNREIRSGRRRLKNTSMSSIENEDISKFLQSPLESVLKVYPSSEKERMDFKNVASLYSLSYEEGCEQEDKRVWVQFSKTVQTTSQHQQRRSDILKAAAASDRSTFNLTDGTSLAPMFDKFGAEKDEGDDEFIDEGLGNNNGSNLNRGGVGVNQLLNSKRIKKGC